MSKHTPGPWRVRNCQTAVLIDVARNRIADMGNTGEDAIDMKKIADEAIKAAKGEI